MKKTENGSERRSGETDDETKRRRTRLFCIIIAVVFAAAATACIIAYIVVRLDVLFIPMALCAVAAMITSTYARIKS